jgi:hypothetical protein
MTIQPNNQARKFQDPSETPARTEETRKPDAPKDAPRTDANDKPADSADSVESVDKEKPAAKHGPADSDLPAAGKRSPGDQTSAATKSPDDQAPAATKSPEDRAPAARKSPEDKAPENKAKAPAAKAAPQNQAPVAARTRLFEDQDVSRFREQWRDLQAGFVDEPRGAVREADTLVSQMMDALTAQLTEQKRALQGESDATDTEQLRVALQRYRSLFDQMLQV